jgi:hypothetical protein
VTYSIIDCPDGRFAVLAFSASGSVYRRGALLTLTDAESCVEELRALMALCGASIGRGFGREPMRRDRNARLERRQHLVMSD